MDYMANIDAIGDRDDAFWRILRIGPQILPPDELAHRDKIGDLLASQLFFGPSRPVKESVRAMQRFEGGNAGSSRCDDEPIRRGVHTDNVRSVGLKPMLDVTLRECDDGDAVEAK
jgi:hypothetical protein